MKRRTALVSMLVLTALAFSVSATTPAGASSQGTVRLKIGDAVDVLGTKIACFAIKSNGKNGVGCVLWGADKPLVGSYGAGLAVDGTAIVNRIKPDGTSATVFKRKLQSAARTQKVYKLRVGDVFGFPIDSTVNLGCKILNITDSTVAPIYRGVKVSCWLATETAPVPSSWGMSISDKFAGVFQFDAKGNVSPRGSMKRQP